MSLVLSRKEGQTIRIGDSITITTVRIGRHAVRYAIDAPRDMPIVRAELAEVAIPTEVKVRSGRPNNGEELD